MLKKWVSVRAELGGDLLELIGKLDYPFSKSLETGKSSFALFECLMVRTGDTWKPFSGDINGAFGQAAIRRERIVSYIPLRESAEYWERVWRELITTA